MHANAIPAVDLHAWLALPEEVEAAVRGARRWAGWLAPGVEANALVE